MVYNENLKRVKEAESALLKKWDKALSAHGGIADEHDARTTAIVLENYLNYLNSDPRLIAEDKIGTGAFTGVNLALLGLLRRAIPELVGAELVGVQAMPTPKSPIFTMLWQRDDVKGSEPGGTQFWGSYGASSLGEDPYYSSDEVRNEVVSQADAEGTPGSVELVWANDGNDGDPVSGPVFLFPNTVYVRAVATDDVTLTSSTGEIVRAGDTFATAYYVGEYNSIANGAHPLSLTTVSTKDGLVFGTAGFGKTAGGRFDIDAAANPIVGTGPTDIGTDYELQISYKYESGCEDNMPELSFTIEEVTIDLIRRQLRGRYCLDAEFDLKAYHGISLEAELMETMKLELMNGINREIVSDLRKMAAIRRTIDMTAYSAVNTVGNYDDVYKLILDGISQVSAQIWNEGRLGYGNFIVGNPETLAFLDRVPGFIGAGTNYDGKGLAFAGSLGGRIKVYKDPQYPKNEILVGYKGSGALDTGYIHAPYLPITATPTMHNQLSGDPIKIFYTRYGKTWEDNGGTNGGPKQAINRGEFNYGTLDLVNFPTIFV